MGPRGLGERRGQGRWSEHRGLLHPGGGRSSLQGTSIENALGEVLPSAAVLHSWRVEPSEGDADPSPSTKRAEVAEATDAPT